jgi:hypothetical protein
MVVAAGRKMDDIRNTPLILSPPSLIPHYYVGTVGYDHNGREV